MTAEGTVPTSPDAAQRCWSCGQDNLAEHSFCTRCGRPLSAAPPYTPPKPVTVRDLGRYMGAYSVLPLLFLMAVNAVILVAAIGWVWPHADKHIYLYVITPYIVNFAELGGGAFLGYYVVLVAVIAASFAWMLWKSLSPYADELAGRTPREGHSPLFTIGTLFMAVLAFNVVFYAIVGAVGTSPTTPDFESRELWASIFGFAHASVWEEVVSRILLIGVPLLVIDALRRSLTPGRPMRRLYQYFLGGGIVIGRAEAALLVFSSLMFGLAHVFSWDLWKIIPAAVAGLAFGYLFLKVGVYAAVLLHFAFDFLSIPLEVAPNALALTMVLGLLSLAWMVVGAPFILYYAAKAVSWMTGRKVWPAAPWPRRTPTYAYAAPPAYPAPRPTPAPAPASPRDPLAFGYRCRYCGNEQAAYRDGQLVCTRCGRV